MIDISVIDSLKRKFTRLERDLDERGRRCWAANEALELGYRRIKAVAQATGLGERLFAEDVKRCVMIGLK